MATSLTSGQVKKLMVNTTATAFVGPPGARSFRILVASGAVRWQVGLDPDVAGDIGADAAPVPNGAWQSVSVDLSDAPADSAAPLQPVIFLQAEAAGSDVWGIFTRSPI